MAKKRTAADAEALLSTGDVARRLGVSEDTVRRWCRKGVIAYKQVGPYRLKRVTEAEVAKHLKDLQP